MNRERVKICTRLLTYTQNALLMEGEMSYVDAKDLKAVVWIEFRHFDLNQKQPTPHCRDLMALFEQIAFPEPVHKEFDARVRNIFSNSLKVKQEKSVVKGGAHV